MRSLFIAIVCITALRVSAQTLIMNEVSQGEVGNQEYVEFVVVDNTVVYDCNSPTPPCIDIRGWIFDDNSGYHGGAGIAPGAIRFSFDPLWECVPLGTIIVVYNDADPNPLMPSIDISLGDGNCSIVAPISNVNLFETNLTTPGAVACSYPAAGWVPGGNWSTTLLANGGDCARIVDLSGCEVFSVCWSTDNQNNLIYFPDGATSAGSATNTVFYFNGGDPANQADWSVGCADVPACGIEEQTPGAPNNLANQAYIAEFNNNCTPITPIVASATVDNDAVCICNGQATASGSGSIPGYTYEWQDNLGVPIGQTAATATNLCAGTYQVVETSAIGCDDIATVVIGTSGSVSVDVNDVTACEGDAISFTAAPSAPGGTYSWTPNGETSASINVTALASGTYSVVYDLGSCSATADGILTVNASPNINAGVDQTICEGDQVILSGSGGISYVWDNGVTNGLAFTPGLGTTTYTVTGTDANGCSSSDMVDVTSLVQPNADASFTPMVGNAPLNVDFTNLSTGAVNYLWDFEIATVNTQTTNSQLVTFNDPGLYTITLEATNGSCIDTWQGVVEVFFSDPVTLEVPNVFTPDNDGINDVFLINSANLANLEGILLNRWGNTILEFSTIDFTWDGKINGEEASEGTYFIKYQAIGLNNEKLEGHTFFQLIR